MVSERVQSPGSHCVSSSGCTWKNRVVSSRCRWLCRSRTQALPDGHPCIPSPIYWAGRWKTRAFSRLPVLSGFLEETPHLHFASKAVLGRQVDPGLEQLQAQGSAVHGIHVSP